MITSTLKRSPRFRIIGVVYLLYFLTAIIGLFMSNRGLITTGKVITIISTLLYVLVAFLFYGMLSPVNKLISLIAVLLGTVGCANDILAQLDLSPFQVNSLAFFGPFNVLTGYLIYRSTFLPKFLGVLMVFSGLGWLLYLTPLVKHLSTYLMVIGVVAEAALMLWLLIKGVNRQRWIELASATI
jgi:Domain of unknown function (DUF4386)